jgi:hypothetical protein
MAEAVTWIGRTAENRNSRLVLKKESPTWILQIMLTALFLLA